MKLNKGLVSSVSSLFVMGAISTSAIAKVPAPKAAELDTAKYTCLGAERAASPDGVAAYTGKFVGTWPGQSKPFGYEPGPYAAEKPTLVITSQNAAQYAAKLTAGQLGMLKKYPSYKINVYPSHRDFAYPSWVCDKVKKNAVSAEIVNNGLGVKALAGAISFPFPANGSEAIWNVINPSRTFSEKTVYDIADVYANGNIAWGRVKFKTFNPGNDPKNNGSLQDKINAYFYQGSLLPERDKGGIAVGYQPNDFSKEATQAWQYVPGTRRVRQAPEVGFDYPVPPAGLRTVDDDYGFNGSPERYNWKLIGKKEIYVPYHNFKINDPAIKYKDLIKPNHINTDYVRFELHRVWVIEGTLKPGLRHIYSKRMIYADEDTWLTLLSDSYDARGQLWRTNLVNFFYSQEAKAFHRGLSLYQDLATGTYEAGYMVNERGADWWRLGTPMTANEFSAASLSGSAH